MSVVNLTIIVTSPSSPPPSNPVAVLNPNPVSIEAGKSATVDVLQADGVTPWPGPIVPFWGSGTPAGVVVTNDPVVRHRLKIDVAASAQVRSYVISVDCR